MSHNTHTLHAPLDAHKKKRRLLSLQELRAKREQWQEQHPHAPRTRKRKRKTKKSLSMRILLWALGIFLAIILQISAVLVYLTSPMGEESLTTLIEEGVNYVGKPLGLRIKLATIRGFWQGKIEFYNLRVFDAYGPWLTIEEGNLHPQWASIAKGTLATLQYRHDQKIHENLRSSGQSVASLPQNHANIFVQDEASVTETHLENATDIIDPLLTAEEVLENSVVMGLKVGTLIGVYMPRFPKYAEPMEEEIEENLNISFLPFWFALDIGEVELVDFQLGPSGKSVTISGRFHAQISEKKLRLRSVLLADVESTSQLVLPTVQELPSDVTLNHKKLQEISSVISETFKKIRKDHKQDARYIVGFVSLDYKEGDFDLRWQCRDALLIPLALSGTKSLWARTRVLGHIDYWPPTPEQPIQARVVSRFGMRLTDNERIRASLASGELFWNGETLVLRDMELISPVKKTKFSVKGSLGYTAETGFGTQFQFSIQNVDTLATALGIDVKTMPLDGSLFGDFYVSRGGEYMLWWAKPLPEFQVGRTLPGFHANPFDFSLTAKNVQRYTKGVLTTMSTVSRALRLPLVQSKAEKTSTASTTENSTQAQELNPASDLSSQVETITHLPLPEASKGDDALRFRLKIESEDFTTPRGPLGKVFFTVHGTSADASTAPAGTNYPRKAQPEVMSDFTAQGLPRGLIGTTYLRIGDTLGLGPASYTSAWFVGGAHEESDVFQARITDTHLNFPGITSSTDLSFAFALPMVKRRWPWVDGNVSFNIKDWELMERIFDNSTNINNLQFAASFKSFLDETGRPAQYMNTVFSADRVDATKFMVRHTTGKTESKNLHALADTIALASGKLREALTRKMDYTPPKDYHIFNADLNLSSGRSGSIRWNNGQAKMFIAGEDATFNVKMLGDINALLEGIFHFRTRTLKLNDVKISTPNAN